MKISHKLCVRMNGTQFLLLWWFTAKNERRNDKIAWVYVFAGTIILILLMQNRVVTSKVHYSRLNSSSFQTSKFSPIFCKKSTHSATGHFSSPDFRLQKENWLESLFPIRSSIKYWISKLEFCPFTKIRHISIPNTKSISYSHLYKHFLHHK